MLYGYSRTTPKRAAADVGELRTALYYFLVRPPRLVSWWWVWLWARVCALATLSNAWPACRLKQGPSAPPCPLCGAGWNVGPGHPTPGACTVAGRIELDHVQAACASKRGQAHAQATSRGQGDDVGLGLGVVHIVYIPRAHAGRAGPDGRDRPKDSGAYAVPCCTPARISPCP